MKPTLAALALATLLGLGCAPSEPEASASTTSNSTTSNDATAPTTASNASESGSSAATTGNTSGSGTSTSGTGLATKPGDNPNRVFQLRELARTKLTANGHTIDAYVMDTPGKREEGMMWLEDKDVKADQGFLFVFPNPQPLSFWMQNTILPLDIIYIDNAFKVLNIQPGKSFDESPLPSEGDALFVLEMKQGSAKRLGIKPGIKVSIPPIIKADR